MPASVRVITIIDQTWTVEAEVEEETVEKLQKELLKTPWGRRVLKLMNKMVPRDEIKKKEEEDAESTETESEEDETVTYGD